MNTFTMLDGEYIIRTVNTKHAWLVTKPYTYPRLHTILQSVTKKNTL